LKGAANMRIFPKAIYPILPFKFRKVFNINKQKGRLSWQGRVFLSRKMPYPHKIQRNNKIGG